MFEGRLRALGGKCELCVEIPRAARRFRLPSSLGAMIRRQNRHQSGMGGRGSVMEELPDSPGHHRHGHSPPSSPESPGRRGHHSGASSPRSPKRGGGNRRGSFESDTTDTSGGGGGGGAAGAAYSGGGDGGMTLPEGCYYFGMCMVHCSAVRDGSVRLRNTGNVACSFNVETDPGFQTARFLLGKLCSRCCFVRFPVSFFPFCITFRIPIPSYVCVGSV